MIDHKAPPKDFSFQITATSLLYTLQSTQMISKDAFMSATTEIVCGYCKASKPEKFARNDCKTCVVFHEREAGNGHRRLERKFKKPWLTRLGHMLGVGR